MVDPKIRTRNQKSISQLENQNLQLTDTMDH
jgi:hypothetical protein